MENSTHVQKNIDRFRQVAIEESNIKTVEDLKETLSGHLGFDWEEFKKPFNQVDFVKVAKSVDLHLLTAVWQQRMGKNQSKSAISTYEMKKGHLLTIGSVCNKQNNLLLIRDIQSQFCSHSFAFGDDVQKKQLTTNIEELNEQQIQQNDMRKLSKMTVNFNICKESEILQEENTLEQLKYVALLKELTTIQIGKVHDPKSQIPLHTGDGIIKTKYEEKLGEDITKLQLNCSVFSIKGAEWDLPVSIINIKNPDQVYEDQSSLDVIPVDDLKTMQQAMRLLQNKNLDVIIQFDNANVKKDGKKLIIIPKMKIHSIIVKGEISGSNKSFGLNLSKFKK